MTCTYTGVIGNRMKFDLSISTMKELGHKQVLWLLFAALICVCDTIETEHLTWSGAAAKEAEAAASVQCSGHGYAFVDTFQESNQTSPLCECNDCFAEPNCRVKKPNCLVHAVSGDPVFMEPFWVKNAEASATVVPGWYRMSYRINDAIGSLISPELDSLIRKLHDLVGNAVTQNRYIVAGAGSIQLLNAAINSLTISSPEYQNPTLVVASAPFYNAFKSQTELFASIRYRWAGDSKKWVNEAVKSSTRFIEIVTSPNNPNGFSQEGFLKGDNVKIVSDRVCYWPHYTAIGKAANEDVMLFSLSKLTGHAGTRFGWAIVKDKEVYDRMSNYVWENIGGVAHDSQLRATTLLKSLIKSYEGDKCREKMFDFGYRIMSNRWHKIDKIFHGSDRFSVQKLSPAYCNFFKRVLDPSHGYAWVKCKKDKDCAAVLREEAGILGRTGVLYGADASYVRLSLTKRDDNFDRLYQRLSHLIHPSLHSHLILT